VESPVQKNTFLPYWAKIEGGITFRGTYHELKDQELIVTLKNKGILSDTILGTKLMPLREAIDVNFCKGDMVIHKEIKTGPIADDEDLDKLAQTCIIQGAINVGSFPKWRQKGDDELVGMRNRYLCVKINEANVFGDLNDGGEAKVWVDVQWAGLLKKTREFKR
jgi:hypothetical protein